MSMERSVSANINMLIASMSFCMEAVINAHGGSTRW